MFCRQRVLYCVESMPKASVQKNSNSSKSICHDLRFLYICIDSTRGKTWKDVVKSKKEPSNNQARSKNQSNESAKKKSAPV